MVVHAMFFFLLPFSLYLWIYLLFTLLFAYVWDLFHCFSLLIRDCGWKIDVTLMYGMVDNEKKVDMYGAFDFLGEKAFKLTLFWSQKQKKIIMKILLYIKIFIET